MATLTGEIKRGFLNCLKRQAGDSAQLIDTLKGFQDYCFSPELKRGRLITHSSGNAHSVGFQVAMSTFQLTQDQVFSLSQEFLEVYADAVTILTNEGSGGPSDDQLLAQMMADDRLSSIVSTHNDYTTARLWANRY